MGGIKWIKKTINKYPKIKDILIAILIMSGLGLLFGSIYWGIQRKKQNVILSVKTKVLPRLLFVNFHMIEEIMNILCM